MDVLGRQRFLLLLPSPWQLVALTISSSSGWGVEEGCRLENIRRVADVPALIADPDLVTSP